MNQPFGVVRTAKQEKERIARLNPAPSLRQNLGALLILAGFHLPAPRRKK